MTCLLFEFTWNIILRPKQYFMVVDFVEHLKQGKSKVKQLIMGAGKTAVVTPLLSLIAGDGKTFVVVMVSSVREHSFYHLRTRAWTLRILIVSLTHIIEMHGR